MHHFAMVTVENVRILHIEYTSNCIVELWDRTGSRYILVVIGVQIKNARYFEFRSSHSLLKTVWVRNKYLGSLPSSLRQVPEFKKKSQETKSYFSSG